MSARSRGDSARIATLHVLMLLSGLTGLGYQMVWIRRLAVGLGHEFVAVLAVLAAFFAGLALGAYAFGRHIGRSTRPASWYAALEAAIGAWAIALVWLIPGFERLVGALAGPTPAPALQWAVTFGSSFLLLLPATMSMGATLPAMERVLSAVRPHQQGVGGLYAANTAGAVAGTLLATLVLVPAWGFTGTVVLLALLNFGCAVLVLVLHPEWTTAARVHAVAGPVAAAPRRVLSILFLTGFLGIGLEVLIVRVLSQVLESTIFTFAAMLAAYLFGTAAGAALYHAYGRRIGFDSGLSLLLPLASITSLASAALLWFTRDLHGMLLALLGAGEARAIAAEMGVAAVVFLGPTLVMGALFVHLAQACRADLGRAIAVNTLGAALAPVAFGVLLLPATGAKVAIAIAAGAYLFALPRAALRRPAAVAAAAGTAALVFAAPPLRLVTVPPGGELLAYVDGVMASVAVVSDADGARYLKVDDRFTMGGTATRFSDRRQAHLPLLLHGAPRDALFLGLGPGMTFAAAAEHPSLRATGVELVPEIRGVLGLFDPMYRSVPIEQGRLQLLTADARRFVTATDARYDVVVADLFHPSRDGSGALYTVEHFRAVRERLREGGVFCQWLPLYQLDLPTLQTIVRTFLTVYPQAEAWIGHYSLGMPILGLVARAPSSRYEAGWVGQRLQDSRLAAELGGTRLHTDFALFGGLLGTGASLQRFAGAGPLNTDDRPVVSFQAPGFVYRAQPPASVRLLALVDALDADPDLVLDTRDAPTREFRSRLLRYWEARDAFLHAGSGIAPTADVRALLARTREPLLRIVRMSPDFDAAYDPLLAMARALYDTDPQLAVDLLRELESANGSRVDARDLRLQLHGG